MHVNAILSKSLRQGRYYASKSSSFPDKSQTHPTCRCSRTAETHRKSNQITRDIIRLCMIIPYPEFQRIIITLPLLDGKNLWFTLPFLSHSHVVTCSCPPHPSHCMPVIVPIDVAMKLRGLCLKKHLNQLVWVKPTATTNKGILNGFNDDRLWHCGEFWHRIHRIDYISC